MKANLKQHHGIDKGLGRRGTFRYRLLKFVSLVAMAAMCLLAMPASAEDENPVLDASCGYPRRRAWQQFGRPCSTGRSTIPANESCPRFSKGRDRRMPPGWVAACQPLPRRISLPMKTALVCC